MGLTFSSCSHTFLTTFNTQSATYFGESFGRALFSAVRSSALGPGSSVIENAFLDRGTMWGKETKLAGAIEAMVKRRSKS